MKYCLVLVFILFLSHPSYSQENAVSLKDGKIIIENEQGAKALDYSADNKYVPYNLTKWKIKEESDKVQEALKVFKNKGNKPYSQKLWIINRNNDKDRFYVEYMSKNKDDKVVFTNDENFAFYLSLDDRGDSFLYGINLLTNKASVVSRADKFNVFSCPNKDNYLIVQSGDGAAQNTEYVFGIKEDGFNQMDYSGSFDNIKNKICY